jgi:hypothetical protein
MSNRNERADMQRDLDRAKHILDMQDKLARDREARDSQVPKGSVPVMPQAPTSIDQTVDFDQFKSLFLDAFEAGLFGKPITLADLFANHERLNRLRAEKAATDRKEADILKKEADRQRIESNRILFRKYQPFIRTTPGFEATPEGIIQAKDKEACEFCRSRFPVNIVPNFGLLVLASQRGSGNWQRRVHKCPGDKKRIGSRMRILKPFGWWIDLAAAAGMEESNVPPKQFVDEVPIL